MHLGKFSVLTPLARNISMKLHLLKHMENEHKIVQLGGSSGESKKWVSGHWKGDQWSLPYLSMYSLCSKLNRM